MSKESIQQARIEPWSSRSGVLDTPPNWKRMHRNQAKKQSDGLAVLVLKTKSKIMVEDFLCHG